MATGISTRLTPTEGRKFALTLAGAFLALAGLLWWRDRHTVAVVFASISALLLLAALLFPGQLGPFYRLWMGFAAVLSRITSPIFLAIVYFGVIAPIGWIMRLFGKNALKAPTGSTVWVTRDVSARRSALERQF